MQLLSHPQTSDVARVSVWNGAAGEAQRMDGDWACLFSLCPSSSSITWALGALLALRCWEEAVSLNMLTREDPTIVLRDTLQSWMELSARSVERTTRQNPPPLFLTALKIKSDNNEQQMISQCSFYLFAVHPHQVKVHFTALIGNEWSE